MTLIKFTGRAGDYWPHDVYINPKAVAAVSRNAAASTRITLTSGDIVFVSDELDDVIDKLSASGCQNL